MRNITDTPDTLALRSRTYSIAALDAAARMFDGAAIDYTDIDHYALAADIGDMMKEESFTVDGATVELTRRIGGLTNLASYVAALTVRYRKEG